MAASQCSQWQQNAHAHDTRGMDIGTTRQFEQLVLARPGASMPMAQPKQGEPGTGL